MRSTAQSIESWKRFWGWDWTTPWCGRMGALKLSEPFVEIIFQNTFEIWERVMNILCNQMKFDVKNKKNDYYGSPSIRRSRPRGLDGTSSGIC